MYQLQAVKLFIVVSLLTLSGTLSAASATLDDPASASWGSWTRGNPSTLYTYWDEFDGLYDATPDVGYGIGDAEHLAADPAASSTGDAIESTMFVTEITADDLTAGSDGLIVALQLASQDINLDFSSVLLKNTEFRSGNTPDDQVNFSREPDSVTLSHSYADNNTEYLFLWALSQDIQLYSFRYDSIAERALVLDAVSVDIGPLDTVVPIPASITLFGTALLGLLTIRCRRDRSNF